MLIETGAPKEMVVPAYVRLFQDTNSGLAPFWAAQFAVSYPEDAEKEGVFKKYPTLMPLQAKQIVTNQASDNK